MKWRRLDVPNELPPEFRRRTHFLVDESLGPEVAAFLVDQGYDARFAGDCGLLGHSDEDVFALAWRERRVLLTHDRDFLDDTHFPEHRNPGVVVLPGGSGEQEPLLRALLRVMWVFGQAPTLWEGSKTTIAADGVMTIRNRDYTGKLVSNRYRYHNRMPEQLVDE